MSQRDHTMAGLPALYPVCLALDWLPSEDGVSECAVGEARLCSDQLDIIWYINNRQPRA